MIKKRGKALQGMWPGREAQGGPGSAWWGADLGGTRHRTRSLVGHPRGLSSTCCLPGKGFEQESDTVRFYWFLLFNALLAAVWRMGWQRRILKVGDQLRPTATVLAKAREGPTRAVLLGVGTRENLEDTGLRRILTLSQQGGRQGGRWGCLKFLIKGEGWHLEEQTNYFRFDIPLGLPGDRALFSRAPLQLLAVVEA